MESLNQTAIFETANASGNSSAAISLSPAELWIQLIIFYILLCGIIANAASILICIGLYRRKDMRTRFFIIIGSITLCRTFLCTQFLIIGIFRCLRTAGSVDVNQPRLLCHFINFWLINGQVLEQALVCTLVIDRMIALMAINYYRLLTEKSAFFVCLALFFVISVLMIGTSYINDNILGFSPCIDTNSILNPTYNLWRQNINLGMVIAIVILYCVLVTYLRLRAKAMEKLATESSTVRASLSRQMQLMPLFRNTVLMHCLLTLTSRFFLFLSTVVPKEYSQRMTATGGTLLCVDLFVNIMALLLMNADIRRAALWRWHGNTVVSVGTRG